MTFPLDARTELLLDGTWTDITADVRRDGSIAITRGRSAEAGTADPSSCSLTLDNRTGKYSPRNPTGAHYGKFGRNTQLRVRTPTTLPKYLALPGAFGSYASAPDAAGLDITGDIDVRVDLKPRTWRPSNQYGLARKWVDDDGALNNQGSWTLDLRADGTLRFFWATAGFFSSSLDASSTVAIPSTSGRLAVRVTLDVNNGAAGRDIKFYTSTGGVNGTWTQLGATVTQAGTTSIFNSSVPVEVGRTVDGSAAQGDVPSAVQGEIYGFQVRNGIGGAVAGEADFTAQDSGKAAFTDAQGNTWTLEGRAVMANPGARFHGEVSAWPPRWDKSESEVHVPVQAFGVLSRLSQGDSALRSALYRALTSSSDVVAYWPCEDGSNATGLASALSGHQPMFSHGGEFDPASSDVFAASDALPLANLVRWIGAVPTYAATGGTQVSFLMAVPAGGVPSLATACRVRTNGTAPEWELDVGVTGTLRLRAFDSDYVVIHDSGFLAFDVNGKLLRVTLGFTETGGNIDWDIATQPVGQAPATISSGTLNSRTFVQARRVEMNVGSAVMDDVTLGHISVHNSNASFLGLDDALNGYSGESATDRILRLCEEEDLPVSLVGDVNDATQLGPQRSATLLELLREAADADMGILYESREHRGLAYRTRASLYAQDAGLTLDYSAGTVTSIEPVEDDSAARNDITASRIGGSSYRAVDEDGPLGVNTIGRYEDEPEISLERDADLPDQAWWRLHMGTVDEARYPVIGFNLANAAFTSNAALTTAAEALDVGDRLVVANPFELAGPPDDIQQIVQGFTETLSRTEWLIDINCEPGSPWDVAVWDDTSGPGEARYSSDGTTTTEALDTTETGIDISTPTGPVWSATAVPYDIVIGGERMTVTAVTGAGAAQTFTVTRSVNGVVKTHATGAEVQLFKPAIYAL